MGAHGFISLSTCFLKCNKKCRNPATRIVTPNAYTDNAFHKPHDPNRYIYVKSQNASTIKSQTSSSFLLHWPVISNYSEGQKQTLKTTLYTYSLSTCSRQTNFKIYYVITDTGKNVKYMPTKQHAQLTPPSVKNYLRLQARLVICAFERFDMPAWSY